MSNNKQRGFITDIHLFSSNVKSIEDVKRFYEEGCFSANRISDKYPLANEIAGILDNIESRLKTRMSQLSLGIFHVLQSGGAKNIAETDEIYLFTAFAEIETTDNIIEDIVINGSKLVSPTLFHNSVHNTPLGYFTIIKKYHNYCTTVSDGLDTGGSFIDMVKYKTMLGDEYIIAAGDEYSDFCKLDKTLDKVLFPQFVSYKVKPSDKGFQYAGSTGDTKEFYKKIEDFQHIIVPGCLFDAVKRDFKGSEVLTDYFLSVDNPTGVISRLSIPFILELKGKTAVVEFHKDKYHIFEVVI